MRNTKYVYIWVRKDLSLEQITVQAAHAALEAGMHFGRRQDDIYYFAVLEVQDEAELKETMRYIEGTNIRYRAFVEPDMNFKFTAVATEPISLEQRRLFKQFRLLKFPVNRKGEKYHDGYVEI